MGGKRPKNLCQELIHADAEERVIELLREAGYWNDARYWRYLGDEEYNYSSVGNQQSRAEQAIIEKLINAVDTKLIAACRLAGIDPQSSAAPQSIVDARNKFFAKQLNDVETLSRGITVAATGAKPPGRPCFSIADDGEGQTPSSMPNTILSLHAGNKIKIPFVQGKFNMGGTGVLEFCGLERNLQLVVSKRNPGLLPKKLPDTRDAHWCFTIVRREDPRPGEKSSRYTYLAPLGADKRPHEGDLLSFPSNELAIFPDKNLPYARAAVWGTLIKLYEYDAKGFSTGMMFEDGLMYRARLLLPEPALPIRFHECRAYKGHSGSYDTTMVGLIETLHKDLDNPKRDNVEWFDKLQFKVQGEQFSATIYLFKNKDAADAYRRDEGLIFTYNGQCHATLTKDFFRRKAVKQDYLWHSLLVVVDCSAIGARAHERLFMASRDRLRSGDLKRDLEAELEDQLGRHEELKQIASERRKRELASEPKTAESMAKIIEGLLARNPALAALLGPGLKIKNPHKPESVGQGVVGFIGRRFPTKFHFKGHEAGYVLKRDAHLNSRARITFETDAANDYFKRDHQPGEFRLYRVINGERREAESYQRPRLLNGLAHLSLMLPIDVSEGAAVAFEAEITDPSRVDPFLNAFILDVKAERDSVGGVGGGKRESKGDQPGPNPGAKGDGSDQTKDSGLDFPLPNEVYEADWNKHAPAFDRLTAMRVKTPPEAKEGEERYDYYINMDNVHLQTALKAKPKDAAALKLRFKVAMSLVALSVLYHEQQITKLPKVADRPQSVEDVRDRVAHVTSALAAFILPMIESVSEIDADEEHLSQSAGEAA